MRDRNRAPAAAAAPAPACPSRAAGTGELLTRIADRLADNLPEAVMREVNRLSYANQYATHEHGFATAAAAAAERALLLRMPRIDDRAITRGEYALLLRAPSGQVYAEPATVAACRADYVAGAAAREAMAKQATRARARR